MDFTKERAIFQEMIAQLPDFILSDVVFWQLGGSSNYPKLSVGGYLLARLRLQTDVEHRAEVAVMVQEGDAALAQWRSTAERKALAELQQRLRLWESFVQSGNGRYATEVSHRTAIALLITFFPRLAEAPEAARLNALDQVLKAKRPEGLFVWETILQTVFPQDTFWFLYRKAG